MTSAPLTQDEIRIEAVNLIMQAWTDSPESESFHGGATRFVEALESSGLIVQAADLDTRAGMMSRFRRDYRGHPSTGMGVLRKVKNG
jgi:hypothetical protein